MSNSFGGIFMIKLGLVFLVIYISLMAVAINYSKAFRMKNQIINIVEHYQFSGELDEVAMTEVENYLNGVAYRPVPENVCKEIKDNTKNSTGYTPVSGACIIHIGTVETDFFKSSRYYKVVTFITIDLKFMEPITIPVSGETKVIYKQIKES